MSPNKIKSNQRTLTFDVWVSCEGSRLRYAQRELDQTPAFFFYSNVWPPQHFLDHCDHHCEDGFTSARTSRIGNNFLHAGGFPRCSFSRGNQIGQLIRIELSRARIPIFLRYEMCQKTAARWSPLLIAIELVHLMRTTRHSTEMVPDDHLRESMASKKDPNQNSEMLDWSLGLEKTHTRASPKKRKALKEIVCRSLCCHNIVQIRHSNAPAPHIVTQSTFSVFTHKTSFIVTALSSHSCFLCVCSSVSSWACIIISLSSASIFVAFRRAFADNGCTCAFLFVNNIILLLLDNVTFRTMSMHITHTHTRNSNTRKNGHRKKKRN